MPSVKADLVEFLRTHVDTSNVSVPFSVGDSTDAYADGDIRIADYDGTNDYPQIAVVSKDPVTRGGGQTQATGIDPTGDGPTQDTAFLVVVDCWGGPTDDQTYQDHGSNADKVATELADEVHRVAFEIASTPSGYQWITAEQPQTADDTIRDDGTHYRDQVTVRLGHTTA